MGIVCCCACCYQAVTSKCLEIFLIVIHSIGFILLILNLIIFKWSYLPYYNLIIFIILFWFQAFCLFFIIFIRIWRSKNTIKTTNKSKGVILSYFCFALIIISFIFCIIEDFALDYGISKANYPCRKNIYSDFCFSTDPYYCKKSPKNSPREELRKLIKDYIDYTTKCKSHDEFYYEYNISIGQIILSYFTVSFLQSFFIIEYALWYILKNRITFELDGPQPVISTVNQFGNQYGTNVVVVQPADMV